MLARATVPVRTCDIGGWTDTWFGAPGQVLNVAVSPGITVTVRRAGGLPGAPANRFVQAALDEHPPVQPVDIQVSSGVPAGSALGTSSAVAVALIGALSALRGEDRSLADVAREAHRLETEVLGDECGLQDQLAAAYGGISYIVVDAYPDAVVETLPNWPALDELMSTVYLGRPHASSQMHRDVIDRGDREVFEALRAAARKARSAVLERDLHGFAEAMLENAHAQLNLHPDVVGPASDAVELAKSCGALSWKVNGAGGDGGSLAVLHESVDARYAFENMVEKTGRWRVLPLRTSSSGLVVEINPRGS